MLYLYSVFVLIPYSHNILSSNIKNLYANFPGSKKLGMFFFLQVGKNPAKPHPCIHPSIHPSILLVKVQVYIQYSDTSGVQHVYTMHPCRALGSSD